MSDSSSTSQVIGEIDADAVPNDPNSESHSPDHHNSQRYPPTAAIDTTYELEEGEESNYSDDDNVQTRSPPVNGEADYHGEIIDLEDNNELNYEEEEGIANEDDAGVENGSADDLMIMDVEMRVTSISDSEEDASNLALSKELNDCSPLINEDHDQSPKHDSKAQSMSDQTERESQNTGKAEGSEEGELNDDEDNEVEEVLEEEETEKNLNLDLEDGEIVDSDDGIPEIEGGLSPPTIQKSEEPSAYVSKKSSDFFSLSRYQPQPLMEKEREVCRFFLRGSCRNGEACRFKHSRDARSRLQITSASSLPASRVSTYYSRILIPPPIGPPVPLLSTEFAPPPIMVAALRPPAPVNAESTAWEQGLKKARELVRRQKGESIEEKNVEMENETLHKKQIDESGAASPTLASISPDPYSYLTVEPFERQSSTHQQFSMHSIAQTRRPLTSRVVVEAISVVTGSPREESSTRLASRVVRPSVNKQRIIPSLIDTIIEQPVMEQPNLDDLPKTRRRDERSQLSRPTLMNTRYADPWARNAGTDRGREDKMRRVDDRHRKRRRSSSSNSSSGKEEKRVSQNL